MLLYIETSILAVFIWIYFFFQSVQFHESGRRHKANVAKRITEIGRQSTKNEKAKQKFDSDFKKMENAAMKAYMKDCSTYGDLSSLSYITTEESEGLPQPNFDAVDDGVAGTSAISSRKIFTPTIDPLLKGLPEDVHEDDYMKSKRLEAKEKEAAIAAKTIEIKDPSLWCEAKTDEGHTYYWNVKTNGNLM